MTLDMAEINAIIFDLGGVLINLDIEATIKAFAKLGGRTTDEIRACHANANFFKAHEVRDISDSDFRNAVRSELDITASDEEIDRAWNITLADIPIERVQALESLKSHTQLFVMSNTNDIHIRRFLEIFDELKTGKKFHNYFDKVYFSPDVGARKPNKEAWLPILQEFGLNPAETLFIDDKAENIEAAAKLGLRTFHNVNPNDWLGSLNF